MESLVGIKACSQRQNLQVFRIYEAKLWNCFGFEHVLQFSAAYVH